MSLNERQALLYTDLVDLWAPGIPSGVNSDGLKKDATWTLVASSVSCKFFSTPDKSVPSRIGRYNYTQDRFHFDVAQTVDEGYCIILKTPSHPDYGECWMANANAQSKVDTSPRTPNYKLVLATQAKKPAGVT